MGAALYGKILFFFPSNTDSTSSLVIAAGVAEAGAAVTATVGRVGGEGLCWGWAYFGSATPHTTDDISLLVTVRIRFTPFFRANSVCGLPLYAVLELISR